MNAGDVEGRSPLHFAAGFGHLDIAKLLIEEGANLEAQDSKGNTPLHYSAGYGRTLLVGWGLGTEIAGQGDGCRVLPRSWNQKCICGCLQRLFAVLCFLMTRTLLLSKWCDALCWQVDLLLASGANGAAKNSNGNTPLDLAT